MKHSAREIEKIRSSGGIVSLLSEAEEAELRRLAATFGEQKGRRPRILVTTAGQAAANREDRLVAVFFAQLGFDVDMGGRRQTPASIVNTAIDNDVHAICVIRSQDAFMSGLSDLTGELSAAGGGIVMCVAGFIGDIDTTRWRRLGIHALLDFDGDLKAGVRDLLVKMEN